MDVNEYIKSGFEKLMKMIDEEAKACLLTATGMEEERLNALMGGAAPAGMELIAICQVLEYLEKNVRVVDHTGTCQTGAEAVSDAWIRDCVRRTFRSRSYVRCLMEASGCDSVEDVLRKYHIFMDGSILCTGQMSAFLDLLLPDLQRVPDANKISIPVSVVRSLEKMAEIPFLDLPAGVANIARIQQADQMVARGDDQDVTTCSAFISALSKFKPVYSLVLMTADPVLANAVTMLNAIGIEGEDVLVLKLRRDGTAALWSEPETEETDCRMADEMQGNTLHPDDNGWVPLDDTDGEEIPAAEETVAEDAEFYEEPEEITFEEADFVEEPEDIDFGKDEILAYGTIHAGSLAMEKQEPRFWETLFEADTFEDLLEQVTEEQGTDIEEDPDVEEMKLLLSADDQDGDMVAMDEEVLKQFISVGGMLDIDEAPEEEDLLPAPYEDEITDELLGPEEEILNEEPEPNQEPDPGEDREEDPDDDMNDDGIDLLEKMIREALNGSVSFPEENEMLF